jgi:hypothetical protein
VGIISKPAAFIFSGLVMSNHRMRRKARGPKKGGGGLMIVIEAS